ncbi:SpoVR family protein [Clostridium sp. YIM B02551]|uniref:SpoVR family protein n=1 Tax=Clostridium sp. YIM B02551 TaxID=2910679 RepID=UPI001EEB79F6|nr:SpoVR family protein [Clostridium sp. YIM B02551]
MDYSLNDLKKWNEVIEDKARELGLNFYPQEFEIIGYNDMISYEAYVGMPSRYPHWSFGKSYEKTKTLYSLDLTGLAYEMVINSDPCLAYLMRENTQLLQILTMAHVYGHNDFFKNNRLFKEGTRAKNTLEMFKLDGDTIRRFINHPSIGYEKVERVLDAAHAIKFQIPRVIGEKRITNEERRERMMSDYNKSIQDKNILDEDNLIEVPDINKIPLEPEEDVVGFLIEYGDLEEWEKTILKIVKRETEYFLPQVETKIMNEGWASFWHYNILNSLDLPQSLQLEFLKRHNDVIAPMVGGLNPYYIGFRLFQYIDETYGRKKIFEVRDIDRDASFLRRYLTKDLCEELNLFQYGKKGFDFLVEEVSDEQGWESIRDLISFNAGLGSIPSIRVIDYNAKENSIVLEHVFDGRELELNYAKETLKYVQELWGRKVVLITKGKNGDGFKIICDENKKIITQ